MNTLYVRHVNYPNKSKRPVDANDIIGDPDSEA